ASAASFISKWFCLKANRTSIRSSTKAGKPPAKLQQLQAKMPKSSLHSSTAALPFISSTQKAYLSMQTYLVQNTG
ncbi:hypothetical protein D046_2689B, partial [Vibrio parahaemolyticus V-223/04]